MLPVLSDAWVEAFNRALARMDIAEQHPNASLSTAGGTYSMAEEVHGGPEGVIRLLMTVRGGSARLTRSKPELGGDPDVTIVLSYQDAVSLSMGTLSAAAALKDGRVRVRGDLSVLLAAEELLGRARELTTGLGDDSGS
ncbi:MAG: SCP2 sterol-binding domain-containing protein [Acidimicrobiales bacterium]